MSEIGAQKQDNLLEADEIKSLLLEKLPMGDDRKLFQYLLPAIKERNYEGFRSAMNRFMGGLSQFAHQPAHQRLIKPEFETRDAQELKRLATQLYTVTVEIDNKQYRVSPSRKNPAPYHLGITYVGEETPNLQGPVIARASVELTEADLARDKIELHLQVPANAVAFELDCPQFHLDSGGAGGPVDTSLAQAFIEARWRGLVLRRQRMEPLGPGLARSQALRARPDGDPSRRRRQGRRGGQAVLLVRSRPEEDGQAQRPGRDSHPGHRRRRVVSLRREQGHAAREEWQR